jgi:deoxyadenosine/deoxycytidine kinase
MDDIVAIFSSPKKGGKDKGEREALLVAAAAASAAEEEGQEKTNNNKKSTVNGAASQSADSVSYETDLSPPTMRRDATEPMSIDAPAPYGTKEHKEPGCTEAVVQRPTVAVNAADIEESGSGRAVIIPISAAETERRIKLRNDQFEQEILDLLPEIPFAEERSHPDYAWINCMRGHIFGLDGATAVGKTKLLTALSQYCKAVGVPFHHEGPSAATAYRDNAFTYGMAILDSRERVHERALRLSREGYIVFLDCSCYGDLAIAAVNFASERMTPKQWKNYTERLQEIRTSFPLRITSIIWLRSTSETSLRRMRTRNLEEMKQWSDQQDLDDPDHRRNVLTGLHCAEGARRAVFKAYVAKGHTLVCLDWSVDHAGMNSFQSKGDMPSLENISAILSLCRRFMIHICRECLGTPWKIPAKTTTVAVESPAPVLRSTEQAGKSQEASGKEPAGCSVM